MVSAVLRGIGTAPLCAVVFSFIADAVEYGQWKTHLRTEGMIFSAASVGSKVGGGLASAQSASCSTAQAIPVWHRRRARPPEHNLGMYLWAPVIIWAVAAALLLGYRLDRQYASIMEELAQREARGEM